MAVLTCAVLLAGCGQVMTRPTATPAPAPSATIARAVTARPTSTPAPYTPAPTLTATVTPTPIIYRIRSGDTLLQVAQQFGVTLRDLQDTNGITDPRSLRVGQELIVPQPAVVGEAAAGPTSAPAVLPFAVENIAFNRTPFGGLWCLGEAHNTTGADLEQAGVSVSLLDTEEQVLARAQAYVQVEFLRPGDRAPFAVYFSDAPAAFATYAAEPWQGVQGYVGRYYLDLKPRDVVGTGERYAAYTVTGAIANTGPEDAVDVNVTVTLYDSLNRVIGTRRAPPEHNVIPRGGRSAFSIELTPAGGPVARYRVEAIGRRQAPSP